MGWDLGEMWLGPCRLQWKEHSIGTNRSDELGPSTRRRWIMFPKPNLGADFLPLLRSGAARCTT